MAKILNIRINSPELERLIDKHTGERGLYENSSELARDALRRLFISLEQSVDDQELKEGFIQGYSDLGAGHYRDTSMSDIFEDIKKEMQAEGYDIPSKTN